MHDVSARILSWNLERKRPDSPLGAAGVEHLFGFTPDVMALTEVRTSFPVGDGHALWCEPPRGTAFAEDERKVMIWSKQPWRDVDRVGVIGLDQTRFISATTETPLGPVRVLGVCIPWHMAEVTYPIDVKRKPWELHIRYLELLAELVADSSMPLVIAGDFNQRIPRVKGGGNVAAAEALATTFEPLTVITEGTLSGGTRPGIDHIAMSSQFVADRVWGWPNELDGQRLSDHEGAGADVSPAARPPARSHEAGKGTRIRRGLRRSKRSGAPVDTD